ncbi:MAG: ATP-binding cassette domain-containing protein, partial [Nocardioidaceae bacterium]
MTATDRIALRTTGLSKDFRGFRAISSVNLEVLQGGVHALVGPNGAGKTTLFNLLTGFLKPSAGRISVFDRDVTGLQPEQIAHRGVARSFQITSLFENLTPREHVELALQGRTAQGYRFWRSDRMLRRYQQTADGLLEEVGLTALTDKAAGLLAYGQKRALEMALVLALDPKVMLLDEPTAGMGIEDVERTIELGRRISDGRTTTPTPPTSAEPPACPGSRQQHRRTSRRDQRLAPGLDTNTRTSRDNLHLGSAFRSVDLGPR